MSVLSVLGYVLEHANNLAFTQKCVASGLVVHLSTQTGCNDPLFWAEHTLKPSIWALLGIEKLAVECMQHR